MAFSGNYYATGAKAALPLSVPVLLLGVSFGALAQSLGWGPAAPIAASVFVFSGSAQFAVASVLGAGGGAGAAILAAGLMNARYLPMGVAVATSLQGGRLRRALEAQAVVDASWALARRADGRFDRSILIGAAVPQFVAWVGGTVVGVLAGSVISDVERLGLDVLIPAFFLVLLLDDLRAPRAVAAGALAAAVALVLVPVAPPGLPLLAGCAAALIGLQPR
jgi:4-azaleucine resistance transporter AzlC